MEKQGKRDSTMIAANSLSTFIVERSSIIEFEESCIIQPDKTENIALNRCGSKERLHS